MLCLLFQPELLQTQRENNGVLRNMNNQETILHSFLLTLAPCVSELLYIKNDDTEAKEKQGNPHFPLLSVLPYSSVSQR